MRPANADVEVPYMIATANDLDIALDDGPRVGGE